MYKAKRLFQYVHKKYQQKLLGSLHVSGCHLPFVRHAHLARTRVSSNLNKHRALNCGVERSNQQSDYGKTRKQYR